jgi:outer membrane protein OmpA-like peptidoglycan-associated protein
MNSFSKVAVLLVTLVLTGCSIFSDSRKPVSVFELEYSINNQEEVLQHYIDSAQHQLLSLEKKTQGKCLNGQLVIANSMFGLAQKEFQSHLYKDAFITLTNLDRQIRKTLCILAYIEGKFGCQQTRNSTVLKHWYLDGQFEQCPSNSNANIKKSADTLETNEIIIEMLHEFDSDKIKPIYFDNLDKVVALVNIYPMSSISIIGHADSLGSNRYNVELGKRRAQRVAEYLHQNGISLKNISIESNGETSIREEELNDVSRVFNRYTAVTIRLSTQNSVNHQGGSHD